MVTRTVTVTTPQPSVQHSPRGDEGQHSDETRLRYAGRTRLDLHLHLLAGRERRKPQPRGQQRVVTVQRLVLLEVLEHLSRSHTNPGSSGEPLAPRGAQPELHGKEASD